MIIVSWNCIGLGRKTKIETLKYMITNEKISIVLIQETKMSEEECKDYENHMEEWEGYSLRDNGSVGGISI